MLWLKGIFLCFLSDFKIFHIADSPFELETKTTNTAST